MIKMDVWRDKLPEDKAKYYNRTRMSIEFFAQKLGVSSLVLLDDFLRDGYVYDKDERIIRPVPNTHKKPLLHKKTLQI